MRNQKHKSHPDPRHLSSRRIEYFHDDAMAAQNVTVNLGESPLGWLHSRGHINDRQYGAGEKLRQDYENSHASPYVTMRWDNVSKMARGKSGTAPMELAERHIVARNAFDRALAALGPDLSDIAWRIICAGEGVSTAERSMGWPTRSGKLVLRIALDRLADHYRLPG